MTAQESLIGVLDACDNFRPHLSQEPLVPFLLTPESRPAIGLLHPPVVAALRADNAWRSANGHPLAWDMPASTSGSSTTDAPPYIAFAPTLAQGSPAARTTALAETLNRWRADANDGEGVGCTFSGVIGGNRWRAEWYDVYAAPNGALRTDGRDPLTLPELAPAAATTPESGLSPESGYAFSMERAACKLFGVVTYGVHMTVYEQQKGEVGVDANGVRVWVPRRAATKPTCVHYVYISWFLLPFFLTCAFSRNVGPHRSHSLFMIFFFLDVPRARAKLPRHARQLGCRRYRWRDVRV
jgi:hypothetical protein